MFISAITETNTDVATRYGAVVRGSNAYVPPGARRQNPIIGVSVAGPKPEVPKVSVNAPDGAVSQPRVPSPSSSKAASPAPANPKVGVSWTFVFSPHTSD